MKSTLPILNFLKRNQLDESYIVQAEKWFSGALQKIVAHHDDAQSTIIIGINGCQGSGKSTLADYLATQLQHSHALNTAILSLDDFYYSHDQRADFAKRIHPLFATRGVPGTHNIPLAIGTIHNLKHATGPVHLPRFDKKTDNPVPPENWPIADAPVDVILLEGWCLGATAQDNFLLIEPINSLEAQHDADGTWRAYINAQLHTEFSTLHQEIDLWLMLQAPSFNVVHQWRLEQEEKLIATLQGDITHTKVMDEAQIKHFISYFQRLTEHCLATLPSRCDFVYQLDEKRNIIAERAPFFPIKNPLIFTDLDGTLLDHFTYSFDAAKSTLTQLDALAIPVIPNTSKTAAELIKLRETIGLNTPFIIENGAAVYLPKHLFPIQPADCDDINDYWVKTFVKPRQHWLDLLNNIGPTFVQHYTAMSEMRIHDIMKSTGLTHSDALRAADRGFGEPLIWHGSALQKQAFITSLQAQGANVLEGGRFMHICGHCNKGTAMKWLQTLYSQHTDKTFNSIALGDGENDMAMLDTADYAVVIRSPVHDAPAINNASHVIHTQGYGPIGWSEALAQLLPLN